MENTKNKMTPYASKFFNNLSNYLNTKLYYFGSVQRDDYFQKGSDIDVDIFTDNVESTIYKMQNLLNAKKSEFKKFIWKLNSTENIVNGHKFMYKELDKGFVVEFSIYDEKNKEDILKEHNSKNDLPFLATTLLIIIKFLFYTLNIIPGIVYTECKRFILSYLIFKKGDEFIVIDRK